MSTHRHIDKICLIIISILLVLSLALMNMDQFGITPVSAEMGYESRLFDTSKVHAISISMDDWDEFLETCENEEYSECSVAIDDETYKNVGIRAKGNTSLSSVKRYGNNRYSFKIEFDCYDAAVTYHGLDKISLNNIIQDNTYMKDYLCYQMMGDFGVASPLCSYVYLTVNGEDWGLYLAVEAVEESFLKRNYGNNYGELYKPDSMDMGGGRGNGEAFEDTDAGERMPSRNDMPLGNDMPSGNDMPKGNDRPEGTVPPGEKPASGDAVMEGPPSENSETPEKNGMPEGGGPPAGNEVSEGSEMPQDGGIPGGANMPGGEMPQNDDVSLIYTDDNYDSYSNIFNNAKTDITDQDKDRLILSLKKLNAGEDISQTVDVRQVMKYFVVHNFVCNFDSYTGTMIHNYYLYEKEGRLSMIPWDYNLAFGGFESGTDAEGLINYPIDTPVSGGDLSSRPMLAWIFEDEEYTDMYHAYFTSFVEKFLDGGYYTEMIEQVSQMIAPYVEQDPTKFCTYEEFEKGVSALKTFCLLRAESVEGQLNGTISSTAEGQKEDKDALIDAEGLTISDMGTMR